MEALLRVAQKEPERISIGLDSSWADIELSNETFSKERLQHRTEVSNMTTSRHGNTLAQTWKRRLAISISSGMALMYQYVYEMLPCPTYVASANEMLSNSCPLLREFVMLRTMNVCLRSRHLCIL